MFNTDEFGINNIYLLSADNIHEFSEPICTFTNLSDAENAVNKLNNYQKNKPNYREFNHENNYIDWVNNHPLGAYYIHFNRFSIKEIELITKKEILK